MRSLAKGLAFLSSFDRDSPSLSLKELSERMAWSKGTAYRFASTLVQLGYLDQDAATKRYRPGIKVLDLGFTCLSSLGLTERAQSYLEELFKETGQPVHIAVLDGHDIVYVARRADRSLTTIDLYVGARLPAYCTSMGKVLLAHRPWDEVRRLMRGVKMQPHTPSTATTLDRLRADLAAIVRAGYGMTDQELELGVRSVAAPIRDASGGVIAAVNVSTLTAHVSLERLQGELLPKLLETATRISAALGHVAGREVRAV
ncbi:MAG: IclR family transcriptional regulator [Chloroflexi bacterium]|nr:IclR family transcriptional regulator [Chloroflexota bacterium]